MLVSNLSTKFASLIEVLFYFVHFFSFICQRVYGMQKKGARVINIDQGRGNGSELSENLNNLTFLDWNDHFGTTRHRNNNEYHLSFPTDTSTSACRFGTCVFLPQLL